LTISYPYLSENNSAGIDTAAIVWECRLSGFIGPVPPPLWISIVLNFQYLTKILHCLKGFVNICLENNVKKYTRKLLTIIVFYVKIRIIYIGELYMYIDKKEVLRYMGYSGQSIDSNLLQLLDACISEVMNISKKSSVYEVFDIDRTGEELRMKGTTLALRGEDINKHLLKAEKCAVMAVTLGLEVDRRIACYSKTDLTKGLIFDACATSAVESLCDMVEGEIGSYAKSIGFEITARYSPGYGDFPLDVQKDIIKVLKTYERMGLCVNHSSIMIPRKSVTAFIGMQHGECGEKNHKCISCSNKHCVFRKDGNND